MHAFPPEVCVPAITRRWGRGPPSRDRPKSGCPTRPLCSSLEGMPTLTDEAAARARLDVLPGLTWRPFERDDLPAILEFYAECEAYDDNPERSSLVELQEFWDSPRSRPAEDTLAGWGADGRVVATAWAGCNRAITEKRGVYLGGAVRPDRRGGGIGRAVLQWEMAHGREWDAT